MNGRTTKYVITAALSASLVFAGSPTVALGESSDQLQAQLSAAQERLGQLYEKAEMASEELNEANYQLGETKSRIAENTEVAAQKEVELAEESDILSGIVAEDYKNGGVSLVSVILGSQSISEMVDTIYALNKVSERKQEVIETVKTTRNELNEARTALEEDREKQEELVAQREELAASLQSSVDETQSYVNGLSVEVREALQREEAERQAAAQAEAQRVEAERQVAAQAQQQQQAQQQAQQQQQQSEQQQQQQQQQQQPEQQQTQQPEQQQPEQQQTQHPEQQQQPEQQPEQTQQENNSREETREETRESGENESEREAYSSRDAYEEAPSSSSSSSSSSVASTVVAAALSQVGVAYVYGTSNPGVSFDCSGLTMYCYGCAGISIPHSSESQAQYCNKPASQAVAGDIVWRSGHVGICIGDGKTVEAFMPGMGVGIGSVSSFVYAGSPA